ncbi:ribosomal protein S18 acetylase RimI-like enzyme [Pedobacter cryoconitis]|uniref:Ribosomal protein S18 acetylase RimI-like enzyme n=1 Tax=Pedobacter cryoconitis TaxID=188932 RepID=A0A7W9E1F4_9SPHI|nr:GNAT family N-acetyltransferase [Pedobacter cryoconitis]MBB5638289.1 ribosomal protein S18 acetylase RimI-like enzyme [Pedobacter cryoconitis]
MESITIQRVTPGEITKLQEIGITTFCEAFAHLNSQQDMQQYLAQSFSTDKLTAELTEKDSQIYFALLDGRVIGYLKINLGEAQTEKQDHEALEIERIYVLKEFHGQKVGQILYHKAVELAHEIQAPYVWLGVWEENYRALRFYEKNGFTPFGKHAFWLGSDEQTDLLMKKILPVANGL